MIAAYREPDRTKGRELMSRLIDSVSHGVPSTLSERRHAGPDVEEASGRRPGHLRPARPGPSNGPTEAINGWLEDLRGFALGCRKPDQLHR